MSSPLREQIEYVYTYGPSAIFILYFFLSNNSIRKNITSATNESMSFWKKMFVLNTIFTLLLAIVVITFYYITNISEIDRNKCNKYITQKECENLFSIKSSGYISHLKINDSVRTNRDDIFFQQQRLENDLTRYKWMFICDNKPTDDERIVFTIYVKDDNDVYYFDIPASYLLKNNTEMQYHKSIAPMLKITTSGNFKSIYERSFAEEPHRQKLGAANNFSFITNAYAQTLATEKKCNIDSSEETDILKLIESDDPTTRQNIQKQLSDNPAKYICLVECIINNNNATSRAKIVATGSLRQANLRNTPPLKKETIDSIIQFTAKDNYNLRINSLRYLTNNWDDNRYSFIKQLKDTLLKSIANDKPQDEILNLSLANLDILYNAGIDTTFTYLSSSCANECIITNAVEYFDSAWAILYSIPRSLEQKTRVLFTKALYGKALARHQHYQIQLNATGKMNTQLQSEAISAFKIFVDEFSKCDGQDTYPYPQHIIRAKAYINNPSAQSLTAT